MKLAGAGGNVECIWIELHGVCAQSKAQLDTGSLLVREVDHKKRIVARWKGNNSLALSVFKGGTVNKGAI